MTTRNRKVLVGGAALVTLALTLAACAADDAETEAAVEPEAVAEPEDTDSEPTTDEEEAVDAPPIDEPLIIGFSAPFSGPFSAVGPFTGAGADFALAELDGELFDGRPIEYITFDDKNEPAEAIAVAREAVRDGVGIMIGPAMTGTAAATMETYTSNGIPQLIIGSADSVIAEDFPLAFRITFPSRQQSAVQIAYAVEVLGLENIGIVAVNDALGQSEIAGATTELANRDLAPAGVEQFNTGDTDLTGQVGRLRDAGVDGLYVYASGADAAAVIQAMNDVGIGDVPVFAHSGMALSAFRNLVEDLDTSRVYPTGHCPMIGQFEDLAPDVQNLIELVKDAVYEGGDFAEGAFLQGLTYDAIHVVARAYEHAGGATDPESMAAGLRQISDFEGVMGRVDFSDGNEGWPLSNIAPAAVDSYDPEWGIYTEFGPDAGCGLPPY